MPNPIPIGYYYSGGTTLSTINNMAYPQAIAGNEVVAPTIGTTPATRCRDLHAGAGSATYIGPAGQDSFAYGASSNGTVVGYNGNDAFVYTGGTMTDLNTLIQGGLGAVQRFERRLWDQPERGIHRRHRDHRLQRLHGGIPAHGGSHARALGAAAGRRRDHRAAGLRLEETPVTNRLKCLERRGAAARGTWIAQRLPAGRWARKERGRAGGTALADVRLGSEK